MNKGGVSLKTGERATVVCLCSLCKAGILFNRSAVVSIFGVIY